MNDLTPGLTTHFTAVPYGSPIRSASRLLKKKHDPKVSVASASVTVIPLIAGPSVKK